MHDIALLHQQLFRFGAYCFNDRVGEEFLAVEAGDALVEVDAGCMIPSVWAMVIRAARLCAVPGVWIVPGRPGIAT